MQDAIHYSFSIPCPDNLLWWAICICFIGSLITAMMMLQAARFTLTREGVQVSQQKFHRVISARQSGVILSNMNYNTRRSLRRGINIDFIFIPFFYALMICLSILIRRNADMGDGWDYILGLLCWLPVVTAVADLMEDAFSLRVIARFDKKKAISPGTTVMMAISSWLKWVSGIAWLVMMLVLLISKGVQQL